MSMTAKLQDGYEFHNDWERFQWGEGILQSAMGYLERTSSITAWYLINRLAYDLGNCMDRCAKTGYLNG